MRNTSIAENIAAGRRELGITQAALAERVGVTKAAVSKWELGQSLPLVWGRRRKKIGQNRSHDPAPQTRGFLTGTYYAAKWRLINTPPRNRLHCR